MWIAVFIYSIPECSWSITATAKLSFSSGLWSVSQMVKTPPFHSGIDGFESPTDHHQALYTWNYDRRNTFSPVDCKYRLCTWRYMLTCKTSTSHFVEIPKRLKGAVLKTARRVTLVRGFKSHSPRQICSCSSVGRAPDF